MRWRFGPSRREWEIARLKADLDREREENHLLRQQRAALLGRDGETLTLLKNTIAITFSGPLPPFQMQEFLILARTYGGVLCRLHGVSGLVQKFPSDAAI